MFPESDIYAVSGVRSILRSIMGNITIVRKLWPLGLSLHLDPSGRADNYRIREGIRGNSRKDTLT